MSLACFAGWTNVDRVSTSYRYDAGTNASVTVAHPRQLPTVEHGVNRSDAIVECNPVCDQPRTVRPRGAYSGPRTRHNGILDPSQVGARVRPAFGKSRGRYRKSPHSRRPPRVCTPKFATRRRPPTGYQFHSRFCAVTADRRTVSIRAESGVNSGIEFCYSSARNWIRPPRFERGTSRSTVDCSTSLS